MPADPAAVGTISGVTSEHALLEQRPYHERRIGDRDDREVQRPRMGGEKCDMRHQIAAVDRMPHEQVRSAVDDATVRRSEAEASSETELPRNHETEAKGRDQRGHRVWKKSR